MKREIKFQNAVVRQFIYEIESWERLLAFFLQENVCFKNRLGEIVNESFDDELIVSAEKFQEDFLMHDRNICFLIDELKKQNKMLENDLYIDGVLFKEVAKNQRKLQKDLKMVELLFLKKKENFLNFLNSLY